MGGILSWIQKRIMAEEENYEFPKTLEEFGFIFNEAGELRNIETDEPFNFNEKEGNFHFNQQRYNALGDIITELIYKMMEKDHKLQRAYLPMDAEEGEPQTFVFMSGDLYTNQEKLLLLIHGSGAVRAGQWARRLIINDNLEKGTQLPYIKWARDNGYAIVVANTNINTGEIGEGRRKKSVKIRGNSTPEEHTESLWREYVQRSPAKNIAIVAHSYGGVCTLELAKKHIAEFEERVYAIALTDSVHGLRQQEADSPVQDFYKRRVVNWASAYDPLDSPLTTNPGECRTVSAGTDKHEYTSYAGMHSIFKYMTEKYEERTDPSKRRISMGEPNSFTSPQSSEQQHLITREQGEGEYENQQPMAQSANEKEDQLPDIPTTNQEEAQQSDNQTVIQKEAQQTENQSANQKEDKNESDQSDLIDGDKSGNKTSTDGEGVDLTDIKTEL